MQEENREICREDREECLESLYRLEALGRTVSVADLMAQPDLSERPVADTLTELALDGKIRVETRPSPSRPRGGTRANASSSGTSWPRDSYAHWDSERTLRTRKPAALNIWRTKPP